MPIKTLDKSVVPIANAVMQQLKTLERDEAAKLETERKNVEQLLEACREIIQNVEATLANEPDKFKQDPALLEGLPTHPVLAWIGQQFLVEADNMSQILVVSQGVNIFDLPRDFAGNVRRFASWVSQQICICNVDNSRWQRIAPNGKFTESLRQCPTCNLDMLCRAYDGKPMMCWRCFQRGV